MGGAHFYDEIVSANNTQGVTGDSYDNMIDLLSNKDDYQFNALFTPGLFNDIHTGKISNIITNTQDRGDSIFVVIPLLLTFDGTFTPFLS